MIRDSVVYVSVLLMTLIFMAQSDAKIDPQSAAGVWLFDEASGKVAKDSSDNGYDGKFMGKGNPNGSRKNSVKRWISTVQRIMLR